MEGGGMMWRVLLVVLLVVCTVMSVDEVIVESFTCPFYRVTGDNKAGWNTSVVCSIWACPGQTIEASLCEESVGDTFMRLYAGKTQLVHSDDSCGELYGAGWVSYNYPFNDEDPCYSFDLYQVV